MPSNFLLISIAILSLLVSIGTVAFFVIRVRTDRKYRLDKAADTLDPVVREAEHLKESLGPLMAQVQVLYDALQQGQQQSTKAQALYELRIKQLEEEMKRKGI